ncbi:cobalt-precorrin-6A reductase [Merismopedia glauca]|uniref:Cobalt-precorrin-6A reductase n=1 Tax=Merismopedia glauca CCAP 1448/3 TaxID=1296344 RepID=A0A2T1C6B9_9CYAN|nr:cobalt-precorrin-6A reductase [Merismopedia glauca]PSB03774.1 cobalt-precorrin-6A reductase [Merismopedia glauca CCAP 1448/3]
MKKVLILGGTGDAVLLAQKAAQIPGIEVISSLAGRTENPIVPATRVGGFGGAVGLANYLQSNQINFLIDATHPFAAKISHNAVLAAEKVGISHLMLIRPAWEKVAGDSWIEVESNEIAATVLPGLAKRVFLTIGRQELATFAHIQDIWFLMRAIDPPEPDILIPLGELLLARGPFTLSAELDLLIKHKIEAIVSKNSGGDATYAKIVAARESGIPVVMVQRPLFPAGEKVPDVESALLWLRNRLSHHQDLRTTNEKPTISTPEDPPKSPGLFHSLKQVKLQG